MCEVSLGPDAHFDYLRCSHPRRRRHTCHTTGGAALSAEVSAQPRANVEYECRGSAIDKQRGKEVSSHQTSVVVRVEKLLVIDFANNKEENGCHRQFPNQFTDF